MTVPGKFLFQKRFQNCPVPHHSDNLNRYLEKTARGNVYSEDLDSEDDWYSDLDDLKKINKETNTTFANVDDDVFQSEDDNVIDNIIEKRLMTENLSETQKQYRGIVSNFNEVSLPKLGPRKKFYQEDPINKLFPSDNYFDAKNVKDELNEIKTENTITQNIKRNFIEQNKLEKSIQNQMGKLYDEIHPHRMAKSKEYEPKTTSIKEIEKEIRNMENYYRHCYNLDDDLECNSIIYSNHVDWNDLNIDIAIIGQLKKCRYLKPRKVQSAVIPMILNGENLYCQAENAAGKTMAFVVPIVNELCKDVISGNYKRSTTPKPYAIIITPTRELAIQVKEQFDKIGKPFQIFVGLCIGEFSVSKNIDHCRNMEIVVGTPGRLRHFIKDKVFTLEDTKYIVMDEVDKLVENPISFDSFICDLEDIYRAAPLTAIELYFTAKFNSDVYEWIESRPHNFIQITNQKKRMVSKAIFKPVYISKKEIRTYFIREYIKKYCFDICKKVLVFCDTKDEAFKLSVMIAGRDLKTDILTSNMNQQHRDHVINQLKHSSDNLAVFCTNLASRGLDISTIDHVIILNLDNDDFIHRFGRTGRLKTGTVHVFIHEEYNPVEIRTLIDCLESVNNKIPEELKSLAQGQKDVVTFVDRV